jgi:hypothetical protein
MNGMSVGSMELDGWVMLDWKRHRQLQKIKMNWMKNSTASKRKNRQIIGPPAAKEQEKIMER